MRLYLDEPLIGVPDTSKLVVLCTVADTLIERVHKVPKSAASFDVGILQEIEALCQQLAPKKHAQASTWERQSRTAARPAFSRSWRGKGCVWVGRAVAAGPPSTPTPTQPEPARRPRFKTLGC